MPADMAALTADLAVESADLEAVLAALPEAGWARPTPAAGWSVRDQVTHLAFFGRAATLAATDPDRFPADMAGQGDDLTDRVAARFAAWTGTEALDWWRGTRREYLDVFAVLDPAASLPWFGPPMSAASSVTARLMETWAHGQDVLDALVLQRRPTARLRHVAHLWVRTLGWSFRIRGLPAPERPVRVALAAPDGGTWTWGPEDAADRVAGPAEDFCLLVTQRRHRADTALAAVGTVADAWLDVAQAFAGPPGPGRSPASYPG